MKEVGFAVVGVRNFADSYLNNIAELEEEPASTIQELDAMIKTEKETGKFVSIGFQFIQQQLEKLNTLFWTVNWVKLKKLQLKDLAAF